VEQNQTKVPFADIHWNTEGLWCDLAHLELGEQDFEKIQLLVDGSLDVVNRAVVLFGSWKVNLRSALQQVLDPGHIVGKVRDRGADGMGRGEEGLTVFNLKMNPSQQVIDFVE
jgi:hypothetical protein